MSLSDLFTQVAHNSVLGLTCLLALAMVLVNGWADVPNAIATVVSTEALPFRRAVVLAATCNLLGVFVMTVINATVMEIVYSTANFGPDRTAALSALCAAPCATVLRAVLAWCFGVPISESHALVAGLTGTALALPGGLDNIRVGAQGRVLLGLILSTALGWRVGDLYRRLLERLHPSLPFCRRGQLTGVGAMALLHGTQDGQKFLGVFLLGAMLAQGGGVGQIFPVSGWLMLLCVVVMALSIAMGGRRIVETVGRDMVILAPREGLAVDLEDELCLLLCTLAGLPASTIHVRTVITLGAGSTGGGMVSHHVTARIALT